MSIQTENDSSILDLDDLRRLNLAQNLRERIIAELTRDGIPTDLSDRNFLMSAMDSMDRSTLSAAKLRSADKNRNSNDALLDSLATILRNSIQRKQTNPQSSNVNEVNIPEVTPLEGETKVGVETVPYDSIMKDE